MIETKTCAETHTKKIVLCADIGTSSLKAALIDIGGAFWTSPSGTVRVPYDEAEHSSYGGRTFSTARDWEEAFKKAVKALRGAGKSQSDNQIDKSQIDKYKIEAVCISGNGPTLIPLDKDGEALPPLEWFGKTSEKARGASFFLPHIAWFREKYPALFEKTKTFISCQEWLLWRLGAEKTSVLPAKTYKPFYWDDAQCEALGLSPALFPPFVPLGSIIGRVSASSAQSFFLPEGTTLISGGPDFVMALLGTGTIENGLVCDRAGSSEGINVCVENIPITKSPSIRVLPHIFEGFWNLSVVLPESGSIFEAWRRENGRLTSDYDEILAEIIPDSAFSLGETHPVLKKIASNTLWAILELEKTGLSIKTLRLSGGQAKNPRWNKLKAKLLGRALLVPQIIDGELSGNAALAATALGITGSLREAAAKIRIETRYDGQ